MKRFGQLYREVCTFDNLYSAYRLARRGKLQRADVARFALNLEDELIEIQRDLVNLSYRPGRYRQRTIYERKPRLIAIAPFRDRVVHHALMSVIEPRLDRILINDCYACRRDKGVHKAVDRYQQWAGRYRYVVHLDIASYFASIQHQTLRMQLQDKIKDQRILWLFGEIIGSYETDSEVGLSIGNLTSQFLANFYLNDFDHWLQSQTGGYLRYVDDFFIFGNDRQTLWSLVEAVRHQLGHLGLKLHPHKVHLMRTSERVDVLGYKVTPDRRWLRNDNGYRFRRRLRSHARKFAAGEDWQTINASVQSWIGHARHAETRGLRKRLFAEVSFKRAAEPV